MNFNLWKESLAGFTKEVDRARKEYQAAKQKLDTFLDETVGISPGDTATVEATAEMISRIIDMKGEK